jgi:predicted amidohydrolase
MGAFGTVRVAVAQATPVVPDGPASVEKAVSLIGRAAKEEKAQLVVLPERLFDAVGHYSRAEVLKDRTSSPGSPS